MVRERTLTAESNTAAGTGFAALTTEWLLTAGTGAYAMGTTLAVNTRRYHGLLVAALEPPLTRVLALHCVVDWIETAGRRIDLAGQQFGATLHPDGWRAVAGCSTQPPGQCTWHLEVDGITVQRSVHLARNAGAVTVRWRVSGIEGPARLHVRPLTPLRDFHELDHEPFGAPAIAEEHPASVRIARGDAGLRIDAGSGGRWRSDPQWWRGFEYAGDRDRGQECVEDVWSPGVATFDLDGDEPRELTVTLDPLPPTQAPALPESDDPLVVAASQFLVHRTFRGAGAGSGRSILAGYPWFADWGRDTMIALPGLLLVPGWLDDARQVLMAFARHLRRGLLPNCFDDTGGGASYHTVDASLWFVHAIAEYARAGGRADLAPLLDASRAVISAYRHGTDYGIGLDDDGLVCVGDGHVCATWMDAARDGSRFTPRDGKPVEISALWYNAVCRLAELTDDDRERRELNDLARHTARNFAPRFWWPERDCLHDVLELRGDEWVGDGRLRPNQVIAASLPHAPLTDEQRARVVAAVREHLLTPFGLRTLDRSDPGYCGRYEGDLFQRDSAYHNGTVWPWLIGPYVEAVLRAGGFRETARADARAALKPLQDAIGDGCLGQIAEVYDGDPPHRASGCLAQAWSVAEVLRVAALVDRGIS
ncbi:MAG: glycogen debranching protein [Planctomycetes bacterium]|nr:glycogen debranching protein [Planctomycetota bacterium]